MAATRKQTHLHTYTRIKQCSHASAGLAQARPNYTYIAIILAIYDFIQAHKCQILILTEAVLVSIHVHKTCS